MVFFKNGCCGPQEVTNTFPSRCSSVAHFCGGILSIKFIAVTLDEDSNCGSVKLVTEELAGIIGLEGVLYNATVRGVPRSQ